MLHFLRETGTFRSEHPRTQQYCTHAMSARGETSSMLGLPGGIAAWSRVDLGPMAQIFQERPWNPHEQIGPVESAGIGLGGVKILPALDTQGVTPVAEPIQFQQAVETPYFSGREQRVTGRRHKMRTRGPVEQPQPGRIGTNGDRLGVCTEQRQRLGHVGDFGALRGTPRGTAAGRCRWRAWQIRSRNGWAGLPLSTCAGSAWGRPRSLERPVRAAPCDAAAPGVRSRPTAACLLVLRRSW